MHKVAIVTGANSGIGRAVAVALSHANIMVVLTGRDHVRLQQTAEALRPSVEFLIVPGDLSESDFAVELVEKARAFGTDRTPVVINNAGIGIFGDFATSDFGDFSRQIEVNLIAPARLCHAALPWMLEIGSGQIINVLSILATQFMPGTVAYSASKAGLLSVGRILNAEYRKSGIRVTSVLPGAVDTPIWDAQARVPNRSEMLTAAAVAETVARVCTMPDSQAIDEIVMMPPKGFL